MHVQNMHPAIQGLMFCSATKPTPPAVVPSLLQPTRIDLAGTSCHVCRRIHPCPSYICSRAHTRVPQGSPRTAPGGNAEATPSRAASPAQYATTAFIAPKRVTWAPDRFSCHFGFYLSAALRSRPTSSLLYQQPSMPASAAPQMLLLLPLPLSHLATSSSAMFMMYPSLPIKPAAGWRRWLCRRCTGLWGSRCPAARPTSPCRGGRWGLSWAGPGRSSGGQNRAEKEGKPEQGEKGGGVVAGSGTERNQGRRERSSMQRAAPCPKPPGNLKPKSTGQGASGAAVVQQVLSKCGLLQSSSQQRQHIQGPSDSWQLVVHAITTHSSGDQGACLACPRALGSPDGLEGRLATDDTPNIVRVPCLHIRKPAASPVAAGS